VKPLRVSGSHRLDIGDGRHRRRTSSPLTRIGSGTFGAMKATVLLAVAVSLGLIGTGGTYMYLNSTIAAAPGSRIAAGTAALTVGTALPDLSALVPDKPVTGTFRITNTGDVPLILSAQVAAISAPDSRANPLTTNQFTFQIANGACIGNNVPTATLSSRVEAKGGFVDACLVVTLATNAPMTAEPASAAIIATISGVQP
jgi:hypothetical protein